MGRTLAKFEFAEDFSSTATKRNAKVDKIVCTRAAMASWGDVSILEEGGKSLGSKDKRADGSRMLVVILEDAIMKQIDGIHWQDDRSRYSGGK